jgi:hypothetical protein
VTSLDSRTVGDYVFTIDSDNFITYATAFNGKTIIRALGIKSMSPKSTLNVTIEVTIQSLGKSLSQPWTAQVGTLDNKPIRFENLSLDFYSELLFQQTETVPAELKVRLLEEGEQQLCEVIWSLDFYSPSTWLLTDSTKEILAAFVQPNHPVLRGVLDEAVSILGKETKISALPGYQLPQLVRPMVQSIYQALVNRKITYSNPPASWDLPAGQRIRNAQTVLEEKVGTCLDTAVLFASLLEASGLHAVIALIPGHAFVGYWTAEYYAEQGDPPLWTELPISDVINLVDSGYIELIETTTICDGLNQIPYAQAVAHTRGSISSTEGLGSQSSKSTLVNITACRVLRPRPIRPMPAIFKSPDGTSQVIEYKPIEFSVNLLKQQLNNEGGQGAAASTLDLNVPPVVRRWLDSLLDLSLRNPLINYRGSNSVRILSAPGILGVLENLLQNSQTLSLAPSRSSKGSEESDESTILDVRGEVAGPGDSASRIAEALSKKIVITDFPEDLHKSNLRKLASSAKTFVEETGSNGLYLALGTLNWSVKNSKGENQAVTSPLILVPVNIISKNRGREFFLSIDESSQVVPNFSLAEKLRRDLGINLEQLVNLVEDESGVDIDGTFEYIRKTLAAAGINNFRVDEKANLGIFNFSTYRMWRDLLDNWKKFQENALIDHFINSPNSEFKDPVQGVAEEDLDYLVSRLPISSDASQARAISMAMAGKTFILQGPPGTGKSQTITNLLARALSEGKRVLFVAQKEDARDVVAQRLESAGLAAFSLNLGDKKTSPRAIKEQLVKVIDIAIAADEVGYETARGEYEGALLPLQKYRNRLHEVGRLGESIYSALDKKLAVQGTTALPVPGEFIANSTLEDKEILHRSIKSLADMGPQTGIVSTNPWSFTTRNTDFSESELSELKDLVKFLRDSLPVIQKSSASLAFLNSATSVDEIIGIRSLQFDEAKSVPQVDFTSPTSQDAQRSARKSLEIFETSLKSTPYDVNRLDSLEIDIWITKAQEADTSFVLFKGMKQGGVLKKITSILGTAITSDKTKTVAELESLRSLKARKRQAVNDLTQIPGVRIDETVNFYAQDVLQTHSEMLARIEELTAFLTLTNCDAQTLEGLRAPSSSDALAALVGLGEKTKRVFEILESNVDSIARWSTGNNFGKKFAETINDWAVDGLEHSFSQLTRWETLNKAANPLIEKSLNEALALLLTGKVNYIDGPNAFLNGYYETLVQNLRVERGFNTFEAMTINNHVKNLETAHTEIRDRLPRITGSELLARRGFGSSMKVGAIGDLVAAIKQPKNRTPIQTLLARHWGVVTKITPCVIASPDGCTRFLDASLPPFDLVVFDEASQIRVAHAVGAIGRAKAVIIVGDSKQMPPTSVAQVRNHDSDEEEEKAADGLLGFDMESILDHCEAALIPDIMLNWHYRSADESLIAFSNLKYYDGKLNSFPSPSTDRSLKGLSFEYVPGGQFLRGENDPVYKPGKSPKVKYKEQTNPAEIEAILNHLAKRLKDPETQNDSIGIVTFNQRQREEIEEQLSESTDPDIQRAWSEGVGGETIFVKNLETVQGSERDVILFSVAFSKNLKGELPLNFGPLNNAGGERRLNVAITRARKQVRVFCSFKPDELINRNPTSVGVAHLAQFLKMANKEEESEELYVTREPHPDRMRKQILAAFKDAGLNAVEEVGLSDFKVDIAIYDPKDDSKAVLGILLDGPRWNSRETVSDRDCLSVSLLRDRMGWPAIERIWLASWLRNPADEVQRIKDVVENVLKSGAAPVKKVQKKTELGPIFTTLNSAEVEDGENPIDRLLQEVEEWTPMYPAVIGEKKYLDYLHDQRIRQAISEISIQLTDAEGPVSPERLAKFIAGCFGLERVVANRVEAINSLPYPGQHRDAEGFLFPKNFTHTSYISWRRGTEYSQRHIQDISLTEISNAMKAICAAAHGVRPEQLNKEVSRLFGITKVSAATNQRLDLARSFGLKNGRLIQDGEYIQASAN